MQEENSTLSSDVAHMVKAMLRLVDEDKWALFLAFGLLTLPQIWADVYLSEQTAFRFSSFMGLAAFIPQILLIERALFRNNLIENAREERRGYFPRVFGQSLLAGLAVILGLLALLIPGIVLLVRWSISLPVLIARNEGITQALRSSWQLTRGLFWLCLLSMIAAWIPSALAIVVIIAGAEVFSLTTSSVIIESLLSISLLLSWLMSVALYQHITSTQKTA